MVSEKTSKQFNIILVLIVLILIFVFSLCLWLFFDHKEKVIYQVSCINYRYEIISNAIFLQTARPPDLPSL